MTVASEVQRNRLIPVLEYFDQKSCKREEKHVADKRFISSVQELMRAEGQDQIEWFERRRRWLRFPTGTPSPVSSCTRTRQSPKPQSMKQDGAALAAAHSREGKTERNFSSSSGTQDWKRPEPPAASTSVTRAKIDNEAPEADGAPPLTATDGQQRRLHRVRKEQHRHQRQTTQQPFDRTAQAVATIGHLKSMIGKDPDPPSVAAKMAALHLALSDHKSALKNFRLAMKRSPERVPTEQEINDKEIQMRKLTTLKKEKRNEALAKIEAQIDARRRERERAERARRENAATGIYRCLLELKQPVHAAEAARVRLRMCNTEDDRRQVMEEIHESLLAYDGLVEEEATNQGAWLTESAGALRDLHASVLASLLGYEDTSKVTQDPSTAASNRKSSSKTRGFPESTSYDSAPRTNGGDARIDNSQRRFDERAGDVRREGRCVTTVELRDFSDARRTRLYELGQLLARKRQFTASRQAFEEAIRDSPAEMRLRERNKAYTQGFFLDMAQKESTPTIHVDIVSRWQSGVQADEARLHAVLDFTGFTGIHRGADTLVTAAPSTGWADGSSDLAYAERLSRWRLAAHPPTGAGTKVPHTANAAPGLMLGHVVPLEDVTHP